MNILAFETCIGNGSIALYSNGNLHAFSEAIPTQQQSEQLIPKLEEALAHFSLSYGQLDALAVATGPGSFTGVRIGMAAAKGLALALDIPLYGISTLEALACHYMYSASTPQEKPLAVALNANRNEVYFQRFNLSDTSFEVPSLIPCAAITSILSAEEAVTLIGNGTACLIPYLEHYSYITDRSVEYSLPSASGVAIAALSASQTSDTPLASVTPTYLRAPDAKKPSAQ